MREEMRLMRWMLERNEAKEGMVVLSKVYNVQWARNATSLRILLRILKEKEELQKREQGRRQSEVNIWDVEVSSEGSRMNRYNTVANPGSMAVDINDSLLVPDWVANMQSRHDTETA
jgi:hypothetical protein